MTHKVKAGDTVILNTGDEIVIKETEREQDDSVEPWPWWDVDFKWVFSSDLKTIGRINSDSNYVAERYYNGGFEKPSIWVDQIQSKVDLTEETLNLYRSGFVNRYHSHPNPTLRNSMDLTDAHSARMVKLFLAIFPEESYNFNLIVALIMHDAGEFASGDSPHDAKNASPELKRALDKLEGERLDQFYSIFSSELHTKLYERESFIQKLLDLLESFLYQTIHAPGSTSKGDPLYTMIKERAKKLCKEKIVTDLMDLALEQ